MADSPLQVVVGSAATMISKNAVRLFPARNLSLCVPKGEAMKAEQTKVCRRAAVRHEPETLVYVAVAKDRFMERCCQAELVDETDLGIGLLMACDDAEQFEAGERVMVEHQKQKRLASVVFSAVIEAGRCRLGLRWDS